MDTLNETDALNRSNATTRLTSWRTDSLTALRTTWRAAALAATVTLSALDILRLLILAALAQRHVSPHERALWMHTSSRRALRALGIDWRIEGTPPQVPSLIVANHLSYLDIVIGSAALPCAFVAKQEIAHWPVFGALGSFGGTIFVNRDSRMQTPVTTRAMASRLRCGVPVLVFPEGTSTNGSEVLRLHSPLLQSAREATVPMTTAAIRYEVTGMMTERDLCWFGDEPFLPNLLRVLAAERFTAVLRFGSQQTHPDRKAAALRSHQSITEMRSAGHERASLRRSSMPDPA